MTAWGMTAGPWVVVVLGEVAMLAASFKETRMSVSSRIFTCRIFTGRTDETYTRFCSESPASVRAASNAFRSDILEAARPDVTKNLEGIGSIASEARVNARCS